MKYIAMCSGGKDSVGTLLVAKEHNEPLDQVVYIEVMYDQEISGETPEHRDFVYNKLKPFVEKELGVPFTIVHSDKTYLDVFSHKMCRGKCVGMTRGFPLPGMCAVNRDCKMRAVRQFWGSVEGEAIRYVGIAADEGRRLKRLDGTKQVSLLAKYGVTEAIAMDMCRERGLLSPIYEFTNRNGCWFCPNAKIGEWRNLVQYHPELFEKLLDLERDYDDLYCVKLTRKETPSQLLERLKRTQAAR